MVSECVQVLTELAPVALESDAVTVTLRLILSRNSALTVVKALLCL